MNRRRFLKLGLGCILEGSSFLKKGFKMPQLPVPASLLALAQNPTTDAQTMVDALDNLIVPIVVGEPTLTAALGESLSTWASIPISEPAVDDRLGYLSFLYLALWYYKKNGNDAILTKIQAWLREFWETYDAWQWDQPDQANQQVRMLASKRLQWGPERYKNLVKDEDNFFLALVSEVHGYSRNVKWLRNASQFAKSWMKDRWYLNNGATLYQPGYWSDHPIAASYVPETALQTSLGCSPDMEHLVRWPLWLESFKDQKVSPYFTTLKVRLNEYLQDNVMERLTVSGRQVPVCTNWSDGNNSDVVLGTLREPYQASIGFLTGWLIFFDSSYWRDFYADVANALLNIDANILHYYGGVLNAGLQTSILTNGLNEPWLEERVYLCQLASENWDFNFRRN